MSCVDGISRSRGRDKEIPHGVLPMEQLVLSDKWARKSFPVQLQNNNLMFADAIKNRGGGGVRDMFTQVNRMSRSRRVLAIGGKQRIFGLDMVCIETILFHLDSF